MPEHLRDPVKLFIMKVLVGQVRVGIQLDRFFRFMGQVSIAEIAPSSLRLISYIARILG